MDSGFKVEPEMINIIIIGSEFRDRCALGNVLFKAPLESQKSKFGLLGVPRQQLLCKTLRREGEQSFNVAIMPQLNDKMFENKLHSQLLQKEYKTKVFLYVTLFEDGLLRSFDDNKVSLVRQCCGRYKTKILPVVLCKDDTPDLGKVLEVSTWFEEKDFDIHTAPVFLIKSRRKVTSLYGNDLWDVIDLVLKGRTWKPKTLAVKLKEIILGDGVSLVTKFTELFPEYDEMTTDKPDLDKSAEKQDCDIGNESPEQLQRNLDLRLPLREKTIHVHNPSELTEENFKVFDKVLDDGIVPSLHIRVNVLGPNGAGKTTLIKRLQREINKASPLRVPTKGLEIHENSMRCIEDEDGNLTWESHFEGFSESLQTDRMAEGIKREIDRNRELEDGAEEVHDVFDVESTDFEDYANDIDSPEVIYERNLTQDLYSDFVGLDDEDDQLDQSTTGFDDSPITGTNTTNSDSKTIDSYNSVNLRDNRTRAEDEFMKNVFTIINHSKSRKVYFSFWDFAGQAVYYGMHQLFLSQSCINMLVVNLSKDLDEPLEGNPAFFAKSDDETEMTQRESVEFWAQSIRSYCGESTVPVILVFTHIDQIPREDITRRAVGVADVTNFNDTFHFFIDNTKDVKNDEQLHDIETELYKLWKMSLSGEEIPAIWIQYDKIIQQETEQIVTFEYLSHLLFDNPSSDELQRLECFLRYQHCQGRLLYFLNFESSNDSTAISPFADTLIFLDPLLLVTFLNGIVYKKDYSLKTVLKGKRVMGRMQEDGLFDREYIKNSISNTNIREHLDLLLSHLQRMHILVKVKEGSTEYYFLPCVVTRMPVNCSFVRALSSTTTMVISFNPVSKHYSPFYQLISALSTFYEIFKDGKGRHIYKKCACFFINKDKLQLLHIQMIDSDIYFKIFNYDSDHIFGNKASVDMCNSVLRLIRRNLNKILALYPVCIEPEFRVVCSKHDKPPLISTVSVDDLLAVGRQLCLPYDGDMHTVEKDEILKHWFVFKKEKGKRKATTKEGEMGDCIPDDNQIGRICLRIVGLGVKPELLASKLGLKNSYIQADAVIRDNPNNASLQLLEILFLWKRELGERATIFGIGRNLNIFGLTKYALLEACRKKAKSTEIVERLADLEERKPNQTDLVQLCDVIMASKLEFLFLELGLSKAQIDQVKHDEKSCHGIMLKLFSVWLEQRGEGASFREILSACAITEMNLTKVTQKIRNLSNSRTFILS